MVFPGRQVASQATLRVGHECSLVLALHRRDYQSRTPHSAIVSADSCQRQLQTSAESHTSSLQLPVKVTSCPVSITRGSRQAVSRAIDQRTPEAAPNAHDDAAESVAFVERSTNKCQEGAGSGIPATSRGRRPLLNLRASGKADAIADSGWLGLTASRKPVC